MSAFQLNKKSFTLEEANQILPLLRSITRHAQLKVEELIREYDSLKSRDRDVAAVEDRINSVIETWQSKVEKLGARTKGLWLIDIPRDAETVYCWESGETDIGYYHGIKESFRGRKPIDE